MNAPDRARALQEAVRVARRGGVVVAAAISRDASLLDGLKRRILDEPVFRAIAGRDLLDGHHRSPDVAGRPEHFTTAYLHLPEELEQEARDSGLRDVQLVAVERPAWMAESADDLENQVFAARANESELALMAVARQRSLHRRGDHAMSGAISRLAPVGLRTPRIRDRALSVTES